MLAATGFAAFGALGFLAALGDPLANPAMVAASAAVSVGVALWVLGWLVGPRIVTTDGVAAADAGLVAPVLPRSVPARSVRGAIVAGIAGRQLLERQRVAPAGASAAIPPAAETVAPLAASRRPVRVRRRPDPDRHAERALLPDRHRAAHARASIPPPGACASTGSSIARPR